ncbi:WD-40 repeat-containing protein, partial [Reticulomyxa filosa]
KNKEIGIILKHWMNSSLVNMFGWIEEFNTIILRYILPRYFGPSTVFEGHSCQVNSVMFSPDGTKIVSSSADETIRIWDINLKKEIKILKGHLGYVNYAEFSSNGDMIVSCSIDKTIRLWDAQTGNEIKILGRHEHEVVTVKFSHNGESIVSGSLDGEVVIWDVKSGQQKRRFKQWHEILDVAFSSDGGRIVVAIGDNSVQIWDVHLWDKIQDLFYEGRKVHFSPNGSFLLCCSISGMCEIYNTTLSNIAIFTNQLGNKCRDVLNAKYFPDEHTIVTCLEDHTIRLWDANSGEEIQRLEGHCLELTGLDTSPDGCAIVSSSRDNTIRLWKQL